MNVYYSPTVALLEFLTSMEVGSSLINSIPTGNIVFVKSAHAISKVLMLCQKCSWFKTVIMIYWTCRRSLTSFKPKIHCFLIEGIGGYSFYFLLNLQLK